MLLQAILTTKISANTMSFYIAACIYAIYVYKEIYSACIYCGLWLYCDICEKCMSSPLLLRLHFINLTNGA